MRCNKDELCIRHETTIINKPTLNSPALAIHAAQKLVIYLIFTKALLQILGVGNQGIEQHNYLGITEHVTTQLVCYHRHVKYILFSL